MVKKIKKRTKTKEEEKQSQQDLLFPYEKVGDYEFFAMRNPLYIGGLVSLVNEFIERNPGEKDAGYTAEDLLLNVQVSMINGDTTKHAFVAINKDGKHVGFALVQAGGIPLRVWFGKFVWAKDHSDLAGFQAFKNFIEKWLEKTGVEEVFITARGKERIRAYMRYGYVPTEMVMKKKLGSDK